MALFICLAAAASRVSLAADLVIQNDFEDEWAVYFRSAVDRPEFRNWKNIPEG